MLAIAAGCLGAVAAGYWGNDEAPRGLHDFAHEELDLDAGQMARLDALEADFAVERARLEQDLRSAN
ncbi:MAG: heavy metal resistance protein, partial [Alphaproteobacteria bacterium]|nr:heavy metal resistance protein [Alphaproteobacteria bacterium]